MRGVADYTVAYDVKYAAPSMTPLKQHQTGQLMCHKSAGKKLAVSARCVNLLYSEYSRQPLLTEQARCIGNSAHSAKLMVNMDRFPIVAVGSF